MNFDENLHFEPFTDETLAKGQNMLLSDNRHAMKLQMQIICNAIHL